MAWVVADRRPPAPPPSDGTAGFDLDLDAVRLVSFAEDDDPVWISERQKLVEKAKGRKFMDVCVAPLPFL